MKKELSLNEVLNEIDNPNKFDKLRARSNDDFTDPESRPSKTFLNWQAAPAILKGIKESSRSEYRDQEGLRTYWDRRRVAEDKQHRKEMDQIEATLYLQSLIKEVNVDGTIYPPASDKDVQMAIELTKEKYPNFDAKEALYIIGYRHLISRLRESHTIDNGTSLSIFNLFLESHIIDDGISSEEGEPLAKKVQLKQSKVPFDAFLKGANHEIEHKKEVNNSPLKISQIAMDHLREDPDYYEKIDQIEEGIVTDSPVEWLEKVSNVNSPGTIKLPKKKKKMDYSKIKNRSGKK